MSVCTVTWLLLTEYVLCCFFFPPLVGVSSARVEMMTGMLAKRIYVYMYIHMYTHTHTHTHTHIYIYEEEYASEEREGEGREGEENPSLFLCPLFSLPLTPSHSLTLPRSPFLTRSPPNALSHTHVLTPTPRFSPFVSPPSLLTSTVCKRNWVRRVWGCGGVSVGGWRECA